ncbi:MAG: FtsW/RodA/SpoVE family cell cycle protein [Planctomycetaceae bacterium]
MKPSRLLHGFRWVDAPLWCLPPTVLLLFLLGVSGIARGDELAGDGTLAGRQLLWGIISLPVAAAAIAFPYREWRRLAVPLFVIILALLVAVYFFPPRNGSRRWIPLGPIDMQPSEIAKLATIFLLSRHFLFQRNQRTLIGLGGPLLVTAIPVVLILREPDLGTSLLFFPVLFAILVAAGARLSHLALAIGLGLCLLPALWSVMSVEQKSRVTAVFQQADEGANRSGDGYHLNQSKQMLALGGAWGSQFSGESVADPAAYRLPAARTDFVLCLIGERWGVCGSLAVLILYAALILQGILIAFRTHEPFGRLVATGIVAMLGTQCLINTAMTVGLAPITGLTLPLLSYGGSSLVMTMASLGILWNIGWRRGLRVEGEPFRFDG